MKNNKSYLTGEGYGATLQEADKNALDALISKIAVNVSSMTSITDQQTTQNGEIHALSDFRSMINTYTQATLTNTERMIIHNEPNAHVARWIKRSEIEKIFESRKAKVNDMVMAAQTAEERGKVDDALRYYYWALVLVQSLQRPNEAVFTEENGKTDMLAVWLPEQMNNIFSNLKAMVTKVDGTDVELLFTYKGQPVSSLDYTYFDGRDWSNLYSANDGYGVLELAPGNTADHYQLKYEYEFRGESVIDKEVQNVLTSLPTIPMRNAYVDIRSNVAAGQSSVMPTLLDTQSSTPSSADAVLTTPIAGNNKYESAMERITKAITSKEYDAVADLFTENGKEIYQKLIQYGNARVVGRHKNTFYQNGNSVVGRGLQLSFSFTYGVRKAFVEDVVFTFTNECKIDNISFGLGKKAESDILYKGVWSETARKAIMEFLENYKTAYALKRLDYIQNIFEDDAVIITGRVARRAVLNEKVEGKAKVSNNQIITYNRQTKDEYLHNLATCFASNEFINIRFADNDVRKLAKGGELYSIQIAQDYYSSSYGDKGYLFLMVDINNPQSPTIKVRTWQPEKDPHFGIYGPEYF